MMKEDNYKNTVESNLADLDRLLLLLSRQRKELELFAIGGTAMVLKNVKEATKDIDFLTTNTQEEIRELFEIAGLKEHRTSKVCNVWYFGDIRVDMFYSNHIMGYELPKDWKELSELLKEVGMIKLFVLNWYDIIISKIARHENRDIEDIKMILKQDIDFKKLKKRFYEVADTSLIQDYDSKFKFLEKKL